MAKSRNASKYLLNYADLPFLKQQEEELRVKLSAVGPWDHAVVVPLAGENQTARRLLQSLTVAAHACHGKTLAIFVVNEREHADAALQQTNRDFCQHLEERYPWAHMDGLPFALSVQENLTILVIERTARTKPFLGKEGVGLARKLGCDLVVWLQDRGLFRGAWIYWTDGDVTLPRDYLQRVLPKGGAAYFPFVHTPATGEGLTPEQQKLMPWLAEAGDIYDRYLRYYVAGLVYAGSPYAYHSIGSTIVHTVDAYVTVRGVPKLLAAEDFYFLNKVAKVAEVQELEGEPLKIEARPSARVPFGTGMSVAKIAGLLSEDKKFPFDPWNGFAMVAAVVAALDIFAVEFAPCKWREILRAEVVKRALLITEYQTLVQEIEGWEDKLLTIGKGQPDAKRRRLAFHHWFDGLKTLQTVHRIRDGQVTG